MIRRTALVTGGASGIGRAVALQLAARGERVMFADLDLSKARSAAHEIVAEGGDADAIAIDVADSKSCDAAMGATRARFGSLDIVVHSAGIGIERPFLETSDEEWHRLIQVDLSGTFFCLRAAGRVMAEAGYGRIVTLSSTAGIRGGSGRAAYGAAKAGVIMLTKVLAVELADRNVTVNALAPGAIQTDLVARMHSADTRRNYTRAIPAGRYGLPEEVADAALFLTSESASYFTGHVLAVDGGFLAAGVLNK